MAYIVFARKYRPQNFDEVIGQEYITRTLKNAIESKRIAHAYLFSGPRGVGKTSVARILAKALNCESGPTSALCNKCNFCLEITDGTSPDVIEIDGASNRGIDEIRDLREKVKFFPVKNRYKIYIIDEVHMLTNEAFNALLKTLEEPPDHVYFVFATTDISKVPLTVASRCQKFGFRKLSISEITKHLSEILKKENINIDVKTLNIIARNSDGALRDAESILDQVISFTSGDIKAEDVEALVGVVNDELLVKFVNNMVDKNTEGILNLVDELFKTSYDVFLFTRYLTEYFRNLLVVKLAKNPEDLIDVVNRDAVKLLKETASKLSTTSLINIIKILTTLLEDLKFSSYPRVLIEVALVRISKIEDLLEINTLINRLENIEKKLGNKSTNVSEIDKGNNNADPLLSEEKNEAELKISDIEEIDLLQEGDDEGNLDKISRNWQIFVEKVHGKNKRVAACLISAIPVKYADNKLYLEVENTYAKETIEMEGNKLAIKEVFKNMFRKSVDILVRENNTGPASGTKLDGNLQKPEIGTDTPVEPVVKLANKIFGGRIVKKDEYGKL